MSGKKDSVLGNEVERWLQACGRATPMNSDKPEGYNTTKFDDEKILGIAAKFREIMDILGLDLDDDSLAGTPMRVAEMYVKEIFGGLRTDTFPKATTVDNKMGYNDLIVEKVSILSACEHHFVYFGTAHSPSALGCWIAYIPGEKVVGLSKLSRIAAYFARRPQIQERLTSQIAVALQYILGVEDVAVVMRAQHFCVLTRGVRDSDSNTTTSHLSGRFMEEPALRAELMAIVNKG